METKLIILPQPILVSDEEIKEGELFYSFFDNVHRTLRFDKMVIPFPNDRKIIAGLPDLPKLNLSLIADGIGWVDVEKLALNSNDFYDMKPSISNDREGYFNVKNFIEGFKVSQSINQYSNNDLASFAQFISHNDWVYLPSKNYWVNEEQEELEQKLSSQQLIDIWLQQRKPKEYLVQVEMEVNQCDGCISGHHIIDGIHKAPYPSGSMVCKKHLYDRPKITNNSIKVTKVL